MNNRETSGLSQDTGTPAGESEKRQHQRETDQFHGRIVPATGRHGRLSCRNRGGRGFTHVYLIQIENNKGPGLPGPLMPARNNRLLQRVVDRSKRAAEFAAEAVARSDDRERKASCNQAVFGGV